MPASVVRESELDDVNIERDSFRLVGRHYEMETTRARSGDSPLEPFHFFIPHERKEISKEKLSSTIKKAEKIYQDKEKAEQLDFLLEANTHLANSEYAQAFTMSWIVIERFLFSLWQHRLEQRKVSGSRKAKLENPARWSVDYLETLSLNGVLKEKEYRLLDKLRRIRNGFIHKGKPISEDASQQCVNYGFDVVRATLVDLL